MLEMDINEHRDTVGRGRVKGNNGEARIITRFVDFRKEVN